MTYIRIATAADAESVLEIYGPIVRDTAISFELVPPTVAEMQERIESTLATLPWLVAAEAQDVVGYAYASRHRERPAYQWAVDVSVYVRADARGHGVARALYRILLGILEDLSYHTVLAGITLPNEASVAFHEAMGFRPVGIYRNVGYKLGSWHDVGWWQRPLGEYINEPPPPRAMKDYDSDQLRERLLGGRTR
ncbi:MAG TPA: arsinothricin resistance N-acetyltransferase ArsN1 family B [Pyrinomonadaceae bacterium]|nr:arsinothricin resistance N-acetyltransferase ArsN1 family B [Pyrinomonadaceae bacterium]